MSPEGSFSQAWLLYQLVLLAAALAPVLLLWRKLSGRPEVREIQPNPLEVREAPQFVHKAEFFSQLQGITDRLNRMEASIAGMQAARHAEIESLRVDFRADIQRIHQRIDDLPDRIIATLKNTGALE